MRVADVARELSVSPAWIRRLEKQGKIPRAPRDVNGHRRYDAEGLEALRRALFGKSGAALPERSR